MPWLSGYENSKPVRIGNAAHTQLQLDVYGEMMDALYQARRGGLRENKRAWAIQCALLGHLKDIWTKPDEGIWEVRGGAKHFTYSKIMAWVAFDRAIKSAAEFGMEGPVEEWKAQRAAIHEDVCRHGYDRQRQSFVQVYGERQLDASLLLMPAMGFLPPEDLRVISTIDAIERELLVDGFVKRYDTSATNDGLPPSEACSWRAASGWRTRITSLAATPTRRQCSRGFLRFAMTLDCDLKSTILRASGSSSHIALVNTAHNLTHREKPSEHRGDKKALPSRGKEAKVPIRS